MRNAATRYNLNHAATVGPRQGLTVALIGESTAPITAASIAKAFHLKPAVVQSMLRTLEGKGLVVRFTPTGGSLTGKSGRPAAFYGLTATGKALAKRMRRVEGLGNLFAIVKGHH